MSHTAIWCRRSLNGVAGRRLTTNNSPAHDTMAEWSGHSCPFVVIYFILFYFKWGLSDDTRGDMGRGHGHEEREKTPNGEQEEEEGRPGFGRAGKGGVSIRTAHTI